MSVTANLFSGLMLVFGVPQRRLRFSLDWPTLLLSSAIWLLLRIAGDHLNTPAPQVFDAEAFQHTAFFWLVLLLAGAYLSGLFQAGQAVLAFLQAVVNALIVLVLVNIAVVQSLLHLTESLGESSERIWSLVWFGLMGWYLLAIARAVAFAARISGGAPIWDRVAAIMTIWVMVALETYQTWGSSFWRYDYYSVQAAATASEEAGPALNAEDILVNQGARLDPILAGIPASRPGEKDWFFVAYAPWGDQNVFRNEVRLASQIWQDDYQAAERTVTLVSHPETANSQPLAIRPNLERTLQALGARAQEEDILFLFITSHGSREHEISSRLQSLPLNDLPAAELGRIVAQSGFHWKVIVVSACYSGGYLPYLEGPRTLVISAARSDRTSFGCTDEAELTYFGRALLAEAFSATDDFVEAFEIARARVSQWEAEDDFTPSEPQISVGAEIQSYLSLKALPPAPSDCGKACRENIEVDQRPSG